MVQMEILREKSAKKKDEEQEQAQEQPSALRRAANRIRGWFGR